MPTLTEPLTGKWIEKQLELCKKATPGPWWQRDWIDNDPAVWGPDGDIVTTCRGNLALGGASWQNATLIAAAREAYPATLEALQAAQGELRTVYAILQGLHVAIDAMSHENIKECLGQLLVAGAEWLEKEKQDADTD